MKKKTPNDPIHLNSILSDSLQSFTQRKDLDMLKLWDLWEEIVGKEMAENTKPAAFKDDFLLIHVNSSPWLHHLQFLKKDIMQKVNSKLGREAVTEIRLKIANI